jgi:hypothetical protein
MTNPSHPPLTALSSATHSAILESELMSIWKELQHILSHSLDSQSRSATHFGVFEV